EAESGVRGGKSDDLVVHQASGFAGRDYVDFTNLLAALGIDDPDSAVADDRFAQRCQPREIFFLLRSEKYHLQIGGWLALRKPPRERLGILWGRRGNTAQEKNIFFA